MKNTFGKNLLFILPVLVLTLPVAAAAQDSNDLGITQQDCQNIVAYHTPPGVDYQAGVDADGNPVVPADITPSPVTLPDSYSFTLNVEAANYLGLTVPPGTQGLMPVGQVTIYKDGTATWNGQEMSGEAVAQLEAYCGVKTPAKPEKKAKKPAK